MARRRDTLPPPIPGLEGPFLFPTGFVLYYDPGEGKYYDRGSDVYLSDREAARALGVARIPNPPRISLAMKAALLAAVAAEPHRRLELGAEYGVGDRTLRRWMKAAGVASAPHGGVRTGAGRPLGAESVGETVLTEDTPEMIWVSVLARMYGLGMSDEQYAAFAKRHPDAPRKRGSREERWRKLDALFREYHPMLVGKKAGERDMGEDLRNMALMSIAAIEDQEPVPVPFVDADVLAGFEEQVAAGELVPGVKRTTPAVEVAEGEITRSAAADDLEVAGPPVVRTTGAHVTTKDQFKKMMEARLGDLGDDPDVLEALEAATGVLHLDPEQYAEAQALRGELETLRGERRQAREVEAYMGPRAGKPKKKKAEAVPGPRGAHPLVRNPPGRRREDVARSALAGLWLRRALKPPKKKRARKKRAKKRESKSALFRRLMRI